VDLSIKTVSWSLSRAVNASVIVAPSSNRRGFVRAMRGAYAVGTRDRLKTDGSGSGLNSRPRQIVRSGSFDRV